MTEEQLQAIKEGYSNMNWEDFRENAGDLMQREIDIYDSVVIDGVPALIAEVERLQSVNKELCDLVGEFAGDVSEFTAQILRKTRHIWWEGSESGE